MIPPVDRPLITLYLVTYNQADSVREAVGGALAQTYSPLEIILSDDCSSDGTFAVMETLVEEYSGPHDIVLRRNEMNLGIIQHVNLVMEMAKGDLIVAAAGDDVSFPSRVSSSLALWEAHDRRPDLMHFGFLLRSSEGDRYCGPAPDETALNQIRHGGSAVIGCSAAWTKRLVEEWGTIPTAYLADDKALAFRAALCGGIVEDQEPVVVYRRHDPATVGAQEVEFARRVWRMERSLRFYEHFSFDLRLESGDNDRWGACREALQVEEEKLSHDLLLLKAGWPGLLRYSRRFVLGDAWRSDRMSRRHRIPFTLRLARQYLAWRKRSQYLDPDDHRAWADV